MRPYRICISLWVDADDTDGAGREMSSKLKPLEEAGTAFEIDRVEDVG